MKSIRKMLVLFVLLLMTLSSFPAMAAQTSVFAEFYIDPVNGNDSGSGTKDNPFKTVKKATEAVSKISRNMTGDIYVWFADGRYELSEAVQFDVKTGGKDNYKVYYKAIDGAEPVISGGKKITDWELYDAEKNIYKAKTGGVYTRHLTVDGERAIRAKSTGGLKKEISDYGKVGLTCENMEFLDEPNQEEIELVLVSSFHCNRVLVDEIKKISDTKIQLVLEDKHWEEREPIGGSVWHSFTYVENVFAYLDEEGEFYNDKSAGVIYYKPKAGQDMEKVETVLPMADELFNVGGYDYGAKTQNIVFDGLNFTDTTWMFPTTDRGFISAQDGYIRRESHLSTTYRHTKNPPGAINIQKASGIDVLNCEFYALGGAGLRVIDGAQKVNIIGNLLTDIGCGGMFIGSVQPTEMNPKDTRKVVKDINILNNYIHHVAQENRGNAGLSVGYPSNCTIMHNEIHDVPYSGVHMGWGWGEVATKTLVDFRFEYNYVHDFMKGWQMYDGGGIYNVGYTSATIENPNRICNNYFKDCYSGSIQAGGVIYLDNTSSHFLIEGNVIDNIEGSKVWDGTAFAMTTYTPKNNFWKNNYSTKSVANRKSVLETNIIYENNHDHPTANWPKEARETINKAGLEPEYRYLSPRGNEYHKLYTIEMINIDMGETFQITPFAATEFCDEIAIKEGSTVEYKIEDESIATVDANGLVTAVFEGQTTLNTTVTIDGVSKSAKTVVSIGSGLASVRITSGLPNKLVKGEKKEWPRIVGVNFGGLDMTETLENITFTSSDESILSIDSNAKTLTAKECGKVTLTYSGEYNGVTRKADYEITVIDYADQSGLNYKTMTMEDMFENQEDWYTSSGTMSKLPNGYSFKETSVVSYTAEAYDNVLYDMYMSLDKQATWPSIIVKNQNAAVGFDEKNSFYIFCFAKTGIELQRYNGLTRTSIFCNLLPNSRLGPTHPMILQAGRKYHIQIGTFTEENGVRIILNIDGVNIMNYLDETEGRLEDPGYFGLMISGTTMNLTTE